MILKLKTQSKMGFNKRNQKENRKKLNKKTKTLQYHLSKMKTNGLVVEEGWSERKENEIKDMIGFSSNQTLIPMNIGNGLSSFSVINKDEVKKYLDSVHSQKPFNEFLEFKKKLEKIYEVSDFEDLLGIRYTPNGVEDVTDEKIYSELNELRIQLVVEKIREVGFKSFKMEYMKGEPKTKKTLQPYDKCVCGSEKLYGNCCMFDNSQRENSTLPNWFFIEGWNIYSDTESKHFGNSKITNEELSMIDYINVSNTKEKIKNYIKGLRWLIEQNNPYSLLKVLPLEGMK